MAPNLLNVAPVPFPPYATYHHIAVDIRSRASLGRLSYLMYLPIQVITFHIGTGARGPKLYPKLDFVNFSVQDMRVPKA